MATTGRTICAMQHCSTRPFRRRVCDGLGWNIHSRSHGTCGRRQRQSDGNKIREWHYSSHCETFRWCYRPELHLMHDNARPHTARVTRQYLLDETIEVMEWPARSPDLNPIEHVWDMISRRIASRNNAPQTIQELADVLRQEWRAIPQRTIRRLIMSMRNRCRQCIAARGGTTSYWFMSLLSKWHFKDE